MNAMNTIPDNFFKTTALLMQNTRLINAKHQYITTSFLAHLGVLLQGELL
jgi:hypothetical protein